MTSEPDIPRRIEPEILAALADTPVVAILGPRQAGKSTLADRVAATVDDATVVTLDDASTRAAAGADPEGFVHDRPGMLVIDEVQRVPDLFLAIKATVDRDRRPGRFLLTGSTRLLSLPRMADTLAGRIQPVELWPFAQAELAGSTGSFIDAALEWAPSVVTAVGEPRSLTVDRILAGGFPEAVRRAGRRRSAWFTSYASTALERLVEEVADIARFDQMPGVLRLCAAETAGELNVTRLSSALAIPARTLDGYLAHLSTLYLMTTLPSWSGSLSRRAIRRPKVHISDTGFAAELIGADARRLARDGAVLGALLETFVVNELRSQLSWCNARATLHHFRDQDGREVDIVLETPDGRVLGIEVKAATTVRSEDTKGLRFLADRVGDRWIGGIVLNLGPTAVQLGARLAVVPVPALWAAHP